MPRPLPEQAEQAMDGGGFAAKRVAVLVDGENMGCALATEITEVAGPRESQVVRRVYGDVGRLNGWSARPGFELVHSQSAKNAADIRIVIDAMRLSYEGRVDRFVIASSDSDFTQLAQHLRERGHEVVAVVRPKQAEMFRSASTHFVEVGAGEPELSSAPEVEGEIRPTNVAQVAVVRAGPEAPKSVPKAAVLSQLDAAIRAKIAERGQGGAISIALLGSLMGNSGRADLPGAGKWSGYLRDRPKLYRCDAQNNVRLVNP